MRDLVTAEMVSKALRESVKSEWFDISIADSLNKQINPEIAELFKRLTAIKSILEYGYDEFSEDDLKDCLYLAKAALNRYNGSE